MTQANPRHGRIQHYVAQSSAVDFFNLLTAPEFFDQLEAGLPPHRERLFPPTETLSMFLAQALSADGSCQYAVDQAATFRVLNGLRCCSTATGAFCRARARLPMEWISELARFVGQSLTRRRAERWHWHGRRMRLVDGTTLSLADTSANQAAYPQPASQRRGLGFPLCRVVALFNLADGAVVNARLGGYRGKGADERVLFRGLLDELESGDVLLGDALYCTYFLLAELQARGVDIIFEQHGGRRRSTDFRRGQRLGERDHLITLPKPSIKPDWMTRSEYDQAPEQLTVRELSAGGKILVTTLSDPKAWPKTLIRRGYARRWEAETNLRHIKTTLGMHNLRCRTPAMLEKEFWVYLLAYNLIRWLMADSASHADVLPRQLSFKHAVTLWQGWHAAVGTAGQKQDVEPLLKLVAQRRVGNRPGRVEPRQVKRRPKPYGLLSIPREQARAIIRRHGHPNRKAGESFASMAERVSKAN